LCRFPFESDLTFSVPINIENLSRSAPTGSARRSIVRPPILSRSADSTTRDFEMLVNFTGIQNVNSLAQVLTELEVREHTQFRRRRRRRRRRRDVPPPPPPSPSPSPPVPSSPLLSSIFQFDGDSGDESKSEDTLDKNGSSNPTSAGSGRGDMWAHLNRQRSHRRGR